MGDSLSCIDILLMTPASESGMMFIDNDLINRL